jgi:hypothetical protein
MLFDLRTLSGGVDSATLEFDYSVALSQAAGPFTVGLYDVSTPAITLDVRCTPGIIGVCTEGSTAIFDDLGSGKLYGSFDSSQVPSYTVQPTFDVQLTAAALQDISNAEGGTFAIGASADQDVPEPATGAIVGLGGVLLVSVRAVLRGRRRRAAIRSALG